MAEAISAGHICLDIIPDLTSHPAAQFDATFQPGRMVQTGPATITTGGSVSNTGLALHTLGIDTRLVARVGLDALGNTLLHTLSAHSPHLAESILISPESSTSYSIVISPPGSDRRFLHHPGANADFSAADVKDEILAEAKLFHFGYPPIMAGMFANGGRELANLFQRVKAHGLTTSLDMAFPDPESAGGKADWQAILEKTLPNVDIFLPSLDEILFMLRQPPAGAITRKLLNRVGSQLLGMGAKIVVLKLGDQGLYMQAGPAATLQSLGRARPSGWQTWANFEAWLPCFEVEVAGATGSGDATIAGFLAGILHHLPPAQALQAALAVGACNVEATDAISGIRTWPATLERIQSGWAHKQQPTE